jgi:hypothetical protein
VLDVAWAVNAVQYRSANGRSFAHTCTPNGIAAPVMGSGPYSDISSICTAAVHAGVITVEDGGVVTFLMGPPQTAYVSTAANGVTPLECNPCTSDAASFTFPAAT